MNACGACSQDFTGVRDFDSHRVGRHDGDRRCLGTGEMRVKGWFVDRYGRWSHPRRLNGSVRVPRSGVASPKVEA